MKVLLTALLALSLPLAAQGAETRIHCDGNEDNLERYLQMHAVLFMERDGSRVGEWYAPVVRSHNQDEGGATIQQVTHADMEAMWANSKKNTPDRVLVNDLILCVDDFVIARVTMKGTRLGPLPNLGPDEKGRYFEASAIDIYRFEDGKVVERWGNNDGVTIMRQLGFLPSADAHEE